MAKTNFGSVRQKKSGAWQARYRKAGKDHYRTFATSADAHQFLATVRTDTIRGSWVDPNKGKITVAEWSVIFLASKRDVRPRTAVLYESMMRCHVLPALGHYQLAQVAPEDIDRWLGELASKEGLSSSTANRVFRLTSQMFKQAVRFGRLATSPCQYVPAPKNGTYEALFISATQAADVAAEIGKDHRQFRSLILLAAFGGLRWGECVGLPIRCVDPLRGTVRVERGLHCDGRIDAPKSAQGTRTVRIPRWLGDELAATIATRTPAADLTDAHADLVFLTTDGQSMTSASNFHRRHWRPSVVASLPPELHRLRFHDLRHSAVAIAIDAAAKSGEPLNAKTLQTRLGHSTITLTLGRYGHLLDGHDDAMIAGMTNPFTTAM